MKPKRKYYWDGKTVTTYRRGFFEILLDKLKIGGIL